MRYIGDFPAKLQSGIVCFSMPYHTPIHEHIRNALWKANLGKHLDELEEASIKYKREQAEGWYRIKNIPFGPGGTEKWPF